MGLPSFITPIMGKKQGYLPLTLAWIAATSETDTTILNALNTFEASLIANGMNTGDLIAYYPMVGGTQTKHSYNFMNTALYQLTFFSGWTHSSTGALPNGTNAYANTGINASTVFTQNNNHCGVYSRTNVAGASRTAVGCIISSTPIYALQIRSAANLASVFNNSEAATQFATGANTNSQGFYLMNKTSSAIGGLTVDKNGTQIGSNAGAIATNNYENTNVLIGALTTALQFDNKEYAGVTFGLGLNATKRGQIEDMVNALNTSLSRNVY